MVASLYGIGNIFKAERALETSELDIFFASGKRELPELCMKMQAFNVVVLRPYCEPGRFQVSVVLFLKPLAFISSRAKYQGLQESIARMYEFFAFRSPIRLCRPFSGKRDEVLCFLLFTCCGRNWENA